MLCIIIDVISVYGTISGMIKGLLIHVNDLFLRKKFIAIARDIFLKICLEGASNFFSCSINPCLMLYHNYAVRMRRDENYLLQPVVVTSMVPPNFFGAHFSRLIYY